MTGRRSRQVAARHRNAGGRRPTSAATVITTVTLIRRTYANPRFSAGGVSRVRPLSTTCSGEHLALTFSLQTAALARLIRRSLAAKLHKSQLGEKQAFPKLCSKRNYVEEETYGHVSADTGGDSRTFSGCPLLLARVTQPLRPFVLVGSDVRRSARHRLRRRTLLRLGDAARHRSHRSIRQSHGCLSKRRAATWRGSSRWRPVGRPIARPGPRRSSCGTCATTSLRPLTPSPTSCRSRPAGSRRAATRGVPGPAKGGDTRALSLARIR